MENLLYKYLNVAALVIVFMGLFAVPKYVMASGKTSVSCTAKLNIDRKIKNKLWGTLADLKSPRDTHFENQYCQGFKGMPFRVLLRADSIIDFNDISSVKLSLRTAPDDYKIPVSSPSVMKMPRPDIAIWQIDEIQDSKAVYSGDVLEYVDVEINDPHHDKMKLWQVVKDKNPEKKHDPLCIDEGRCMSAPVLWGLNATHLWWECRSFVHKEVPEDSSFAEGETKSREMCLRFFQAFKGSIELEGFIREQMEMSPPLICFNSEGNVGFGSPEKLLQNFVKYVEAHPETGRMSAVYVIYKMLEEDGHFCPQ